MARHGVTRLAVIADVHGNLPALEAVATAIADDVDEWICAGDIAGHLPMVDEVVAVLRRLGARCVRGNHDHALVEGLPIPGSSAATRALQIQRRAVSAETRAWLAGLPEHLEIDVDGHRLAVRHGGPRDALYQRVETVDEELIRFAAGRTVVLGNTHRTICEIGAEHTVINPGALGMPMDGDRRARAMILDLSTQQVEAVRIDYRADDLLERLDHLGYDERYKNCLAAGRWVGFQEDPPAVPVIVAGAAIYGEMLAELIAGRSDTRLVGFVDDRVTGSFAGVPVLGPLGRLAEIAADHGVVDVAVALGENATRREISQRVWRSGVRPARLIHPTAVVSASAQLGFGCTIDAGAYVGPHCVLEDGVSIWPHAVVGHDTRVGAYASVKPGAVIGGQSRIAAGEKVALGAVLPSYSAIGAA